MAAVIRRSVESAAATSHDLVVVGGGIHGAMLALEASRRGLRPLLLEREDFGGQTTWNTLRILHGGLRYLQRLDLLRFRESVRERRWFLRCFSDLVRPMAFLMPLYGRGLRRPSVLWAALRLNDLLAPDRNLGVEEERRLPPGRLLDIAETKELYPGVRSKGLRGSALWYDGFMEDAPRLLIESLRWACELGAVCLNYLEVRELLVQDGRVAGVVGIDRPRGEMFEFRAPVVVNCAGPRSPEVADALDRAVSDLFHPCLAFNVLLRSEPRSEVGLALTSPSPGRHTYFLVPWRGMMLAGTFHAPWEGPVEAPVRPSEAHLEAFLADLNGADPGLCLHREDVMRVFGGLLPARHRGSASLASRAVVRDHGTMGGPRGLFSVSGVKFTTARSVAESVLRRIYGRSGVRPCAAGPAMRPAPALRHSAREFETLDRLDPAAAASYVRRLVAEESAICLADVVFRRTDWGTELPSAKPMAQRIARLLDLPGADLEEPYFL